MKMRTRKYSVREDYFVSANCILCEYQFKDKFQGNFNKMPMDLNLC